MAKKGKPKLWFLVGMPSPPQGNSSTPAGSMPPPGPPVGRGQPGTGGFLWVFGAGAQKFDGQRLKALKASRKHAVGGGACPHSCRLKQPGAGASSLSAASFSQVGTSKIRGSGGCLGGAVGSASFWHHPGQYNMPGVMGRRCTVALSMAGG